MFLLTTYALEIGFGRVWVFVGELSSQSEKSIERDILLKRLEIRSCPTEFGEGDLEYAQS